MAGLMEKDVTVAGGTADIETGEFLIIKCSLCPITFYNYKCIKIGFSAKLLSFVHLYVINRNDILHADGNPILHPAA